VTVISSPTLSAFGPYLESQPEIAWTLPPTIATRPVAIRPLASMRSEDGIDDPERLERAGHLGFLPNAYNPASE
jgi:hypothetical protein